MAGFLSNETAGEEAWTFLGPFVGAAVALIFAAFISGKLEFGRANYFITTFLGLIPWIITAAGPIISVITNDITYSISSLTGIVGTLFTSFIGSERFTNFSKSLFGWFGEGYSRFIPYVFVLVVFASVGGSLAGTGYLAGSATAVVSMALIVVPLFLAQFDLLRRSDIASVPITSFPGKIAAYITGTPIVAAAATGGGIVEITGETCVLPGYDGSEVQLAPSNIVLPMTILLCHLIEYLDNQNSIGSKSVGSLIAIIFGLQYIAFYKSNCSKYYRWGYAAPLIALALAGMYAGSAYGILKYLVGGRTENFGTEGIFHPSTAAAPPAPKTAGKSDIKIKTSGTAVTASADLFDKAEDEDYEEVVGVLFKDGEPISDISILKS